MADTRDQIILMADDDPAQLLLAEASLAGAGFVVHTVGDGAAAVERYDQVRPDAVILDVNMPGMSGIEACRAIRRKAGARALPILILTGRNDLASISEAFAAGASDFAQKGINPRLLVERVRFLLRDRDLQEELQSSRSRLLLAQRIARVGHWELTTEGRTLQVSPMLGEILGVDAAALHSFEDFVMMLDSSQRFGARQAFLACATGGERSGSDHRLSTPAGDAIHVRQEVELVAAEGQPHGATVIVTLQDLTRLHKAEEAVRLLSYCDTATGLPNRRQLSEQVSAALADDSGMTSTGVVAFRIHNLESVSQAHGLDAANALVKRLAERIEAGLSDLSDDGAIPWRAASAAVCRTAEAQLALVLRSRTSAEHLCEIAHGMLEALAARPAADPQDYQPALSAGIAFANGENRSADLTLQQAHAAAEQAAEPWAFQVYSPASQARSRRRLQIEAALRGAIERGELSLVFQPRVTSDSYELTAVECLARWKHSQLGEVDAGEFISVAESAGLIEQIGDWVLNEACRQLAVWRAHFERDFFASVNVSARQLRDARFPEIVHAALQRNGLPPNALELELTESTAIQLTPRIRATLDTLRAQGVRIALDDFGTGFSSLNQVRRVHFDCLKLDRSLIADLYTDLGAQGVASAVIGMARGMRARSVAEGVEDSATLEMLAALGCDEILGHYVSPPLKPRDFESWLEDGGAVALDRKGTLDVIDALEAVERRMRGGG